MSAGFRLLGPILHFKLSSVSFNDLDTNLLFFFIPFSFLSSLLPFPFYSHFFCLGLCLFLLVLSSFIKRPCWWVGWLVVFVFCPFLAIYFTVYHFLSIYLSIPVSSLSIYRSFSLSIYLSIYSVLIYSLILFYSYLSLYLSSSIGGSFNK